MRARCAVLAMVGTAAVQAAAVAETAQAGFIAAPVPLPVNSVVFAVRDSLPGWLSYLQAIEFINDRMKYRDPLSAFFVSSADELCFRTFPSGLYAIYDGYYSDWCMYPQAVSSIQTITNTVTNQNELILSCGYAFPQCVRQHGYPVFPGYVYSAANSVAVPTTAYREQAVVLRDLIYVMKGGRGFAVRAGLANISD